MATASFYKGSDEIPGPKCDTCSSNNKVTDAISYCMVCTEYLCQSCDMAHGTFRQTKSHKVVRGSNMPSLRPKPTLPCMYCDTHKSTLLNTYCKTHAQVICPTCKLASHKQCDTNDIKQHCARKDFTKEMSEVSNRLADIKATYERVLNDRKVNKASLKTQIQKCMTDIHTFRKEINDKLDTLENELSSETRQLEISVKKEIDGHVTVTNDILSQMADLEKSLSECKLSQENEIMFVGLTKSSSDLKDYERIIDNIQTDIYPLDFQFRPNDVLSDMVRQLQSVGTVTDSRPGQTGQGSVLDWTATDRQDIDVTDNRPGQTGQRSVLDWTATDRLDIDVGSKYIEGCTFMPNGELVLACVNDGIKLFDTNFKFKSHVSVPAVDVSVINDTEVIVTQGKRKQLVRVTLYPDMAEKATIKLDRLCDGVDVHGENIYVTCHDNPTGNGEVKLVNVRGEEQRWFGVKTRECKFERPECVKVNGDGSKIFVSDGETNIVTCLDSQGHVIYKYSDKELKTPFGLYVGGDDNLLVCGLNSDNVHVVGHDGRKQKVLLSEKDGVECPLCVTYRHSDGCLVVGVHEVAKTEKKLKIYKTR